MAREPVVDIYCSADPGKVLKILKAQIDFGTRFPNFRFILTDDPTVFFDQRLEGQTRWASPLQSYLELMKGDKRDKETASEVRKHILKRIDQLGSGVSA